MIGSAKMCMCIECLSSSNSGKMYRKYNIQSTFSEIVCTSAAVVESFPLSSYWSLSSVAHFHAKAQS